MSTAKYQVVARLLSVFGEETVLLPVPRGEKGCRVKEWPNTTWAWAFSAAATAVASLASTPISVEPM